MVAPLLPGVQLEIVHDADIALAAGGEGRQPGVVVVAGTGSIAVGYDRAGRRARAGGWGHLLGDEGSGYDIACKGLSAATRAYDGRSVRTLLVERLPVAAGTEGLEGLANRIYLENWTVGQVASLAPVVLAAAEAGDPAAVEILDAAALDLAQTARAVISQLELENQAFPLVLSGGLFTGQNRMFDLVRVAILDFAPRASVSLPKHEPAYGAALLALEQAGK
jgi:N-acetylglucosamine kinase